MSIIGKQYKYWVVLENIDKDTYRCKCVLCGAIEDIKYNSLHDTRSKECRMCSSIRRREIERQTIIGKKFGKLLVQDIMYEKYKEIIKPKAVCICECGKKHITLLASLRNGSTKSCGCIVKGVNTGNISKWIYNYYKTGAKKRNICFNISMKYMYDIWKKQEGKCALTGTALIMLSHLSRQGDRGNKNRKNMTASLDRIDSNKGYVEGNVQWIHKDINMIKNKYDEGVFISMCHAVSSYRKNPVDIDWKSKE